MSIKSLIVVVMIASSLLFKCSLDDVSRLPLWVNPKQCPKHALFMMGRKLMIRLMMMVSVNRHGWCIEQSGHLRRLSFSVVFLFSHSVSRQSSVDSIWQFFIKQIATDTFQSVLLSSCSSLSLSLSFSCYGTDTATHTHTHTFPCHYVNPAVRLSFTEIISSLSFSKKDSDYRRQIEHRRNNHDPICVAFFFYSLFYTHSDRHNESRTY